MSLLNLSYQMSAGRRGLEAVEDQFGVHLIQRSGAPPIRLTGRRIYLAKGKTGHFVSLWEKRSPGLVLSYCCPLDADGVLHAVGVDDVVEAAEVLEAQCFQLVPEQAKFLFDDGPDGWGRTLRLLKHHNRIDDFRLLTGRAIADWADWPSAVGLSSHAQHGEENADC